MGKKVVKTKKENTNNKSKKPLIITLCSSILAVVLILGVVLALCLNNDKDTKHNMFSQKLLAVEFNDGWGYVNDKGETVIEGQFSEAYQFADNGLALVSVNGMYGYINTKGEFEINPMYNEALPFSQESKLARVKRNMKYGFIDKSGEEIIPCQYEYVEPFSYGLALVKVGGQYGFINEKNKFVINPIYDRAESFKNKKVTVVGNKKEETGEYLYACVANDGTELTDFMLKEIKISEEHIITFDGTYYGFSELDLVPIFKTEKQILNFLIDLDPFGSVEEKLIPYRDNENNKFGFLNYSGQPEISATYDMIGDFNNGMAMVKTSNKYGFINTSGKLIVNNEYDFVRNYSDGYAVVGKEVDSKMTYGIVDKEGKMVIELKYKTLGDIVNGVAYFNTFDNEKIGYLDTTGNVVIDEEYDLIQGDEAYNFSDDGFVVVKQGDKFGVLNKEYRFVVNPYFLDICYFNEF